MHKNPPPEYRNSNIELLRIVSMFLVLLIHFSAVIPVSPDKLCSAPLQTIIGIQLHSLAVVCVNCFILISGYFQIRWKLKSFVGLLYQVLFWLAIGLVIAKCINIPIESNIGVVVSYFSDRWFVPAYIGLYVLAPVINGFIESVDARRLWRYVLIFYVFSTVVGYLFRSHEFNEGMSVISLIGLYLLGALIRKGNIRFFAFRASTDLWLYLGGSVLLTALSIGLLLLDVNKSPLGYLNPVVIAMSVYLFLFFTKIRIRHNRIINFIAGSAFAVYLFHMHPYLYGEYQKYSRISLNFGWSTPLVVVSYLVLIFMIAVALDRLRIGSFNLLLKSGRKFGR